MATLVGDETGRSVLGYWLRRTPRRNRNAQQDGGVINFKSLT